MKSRFNDKAFEIREHKIMKSNLKSEHRPDICWLFFSKKLKAEKAFIFIISTTHIFLIKIKKE